MTRFIGLHSLPGFTQEMMARVRGQASGSGIEIVRVVGEADTGRVICEVEAPDRESFVAWLNKINLPYDEVCQVDMEMGLAGQDALHQSQGALARVKGLLAART